MITNGHVVISCEITIILTWTAVSAARPRLSHVVDPRGAELAEVFKTQDTARLWRVNLAIPNLLDLVDSLVSRELI